MLFEHPFLRLLTLIQATEPRVANAIKLLLAPLYNTPYPTSNQLAVSSDLTIRLDILFTPCATDQSQGVWEWVFSWKITRSIIPQTNSDGKFPEYQPPQNPSSPVSVGDQPPLVTPPAVPIKPNATDSATEGSAARGRGKSHSSQPWSLTVH